MGFCLLAGQELILQLVQLVVNTLSVCNGISSIHVGSIKSVGSLAVLDEVGICNDILNSVLVVCNYLSGNFVGECQIEELTHLQVNALLLGGGNIIANLGVALISQQCDGGELTGVDVVLADAVLNVDNVGLLTSQGDLLIVVATDLNEVQVDACSLLQSQADQVGVAAGGVGKLNLAGMSLCILNQFGQGLIVGVISVDAQNGGALR